MGAKLTRRSRPTLDARVILRVNSSVALCGAVPRVVLFMFPSSPVKFDCLRILRFGCCVSQSTRVRGNSTRYTRTILRLSLLRGVRSSSGLAVAMLFARCRARGAPDDWATLSDLRERGERDIRFGVACLDAIGGREGTRCKWMGSRFTGSRGGVYRLFITTTPVIFVLSTPDALQMHYRCITYTNLGCSNALIYLRDFCT